MDEEEEPEEEEEEEEGEQDAEGEEGEEGEEDEESQEEATQQGGHQAAFDMDSFLMESQANSGMHACMYARARMHCMAWHARMHACIHAYMHG